MRPAIAPDALAGIIERAPPRLVKKLDGSPDAAGAFTWSTEGDVTTVGTDAGETVTVRAVDSRVKSVDAIACSCLLSPKCFHVLAVASALPIAEEHAPATAAAAHALEAKVAEPSASNGAPERASSEQIAAAERTLATLGAVLASGASAMGAVARADLLRAVHASRVAGLYRLSAATLAVAESARALRERTAGFALSELTTSLGEAATLARAIARGEISATLMGVARRAYEEIGGRRVVGFACEPVIAKTGYAGVVTYVLSDRDEIFTLEEVAPGDEGRALAAYSSTVRVGDASLTHRELSRAGLFLQGATASADGRLGAGASVRAVTASGAQLGDPPLSARFEVPLSTQVERALVASTTWMAPRGATLVFVRGRVVGPTDGGVLFAAQSGLANEVEGAPTIVRLVAPIANERLATRENLRLIGATAGLEVRVVGRVSRARPLEIDVVTIGPLGEGWSLAPASGGKVHIAYDQLTRAQLKVDAIRERAAGLLAAPLGTSMPAHARRDPLAALERRVERMILGGRRTLTVRNAVEVSREATELERALAPTASGALRGLLHASTNPSERALLEGWTAAFATARAMRLGLARRAWIPSS